MLNQMWIPFRLPSLNEYIDKINSNRHAGNRFKQDTQSDIAWFLRGRYPGKIYVKFTWYEPNRKRDKDNIASAKKFILDALQAKGVIDNDINVEGFEDRFVYGQGEGVLVEIMEV